MLMTNRRLQLIPVELSLRALLFSFTSMIESDNNTAPAHSGVYDVHAEVVKPTQIENRNEIIS